MLNVLGHEPAALLAELTLQHGFSTFIVASDDADVLTRFAREVIPDVRRQVDVARTIRSEGHTSFLTTERERKQS